jgi:hypothetical protein
MDMTLQLHQNYIFALTINVFIISSSLSRVDHATYNICFVVKGPPMESNEIVWFGRFGCRRRPWCDEPPIDKRSA